jgi:hypothetical protein
MKNIFGLLFIMIILSCNDKDKVLLSDDFRDITNQLSLQDFEKIKMFILDSGEFEPFFNKYQQQPIYSFDGFSATLLPEIGQLNITCDPEISDFNQLVIYDSDLQSKYMYFLIIRLGDFNRENIELPDYDGLKENKVYLLRYSDYDLDEMEDKSEYYITQMKNTIE